ncbi:hypothetical protein BRC70_05540 [Halobacteriales archaeon QH_6_68_27]|nr:MAG: hypothetical protein BRC70_05540 [Halobacteriales archaeon QH_6_68_27]
MTFTDRDLSPSLAAVRERHAPDALVLDSARDFETLAPARAEDLGLLVDSLDPVSYPASWLPPDAPEVLVRYAGGEFTVGAPEALVEVGREVPEQFLGFFEARYADLAAAVGDRLDPVGTYQLAAALHTAHLGLDTRETFATWEDDHPDLFDAWVDAGDRLEPRLADLPADLATGTTDFGDAAELACGAIKHGIEPPTPFGALDSPAYREYGADFAVQWAEKTFENLD